MENKNITTEDLARMIQKGFGDTAKKDEVNARFNQVDSRLETIEKLPNSRLYIYTLANQGSAER